MIGRLRGEIVEIEKDTVILETGGTGYRVRVPDTSIPVLSGNKNAILHIETVVRQDAIILYGFLTIEELRMFRLLVSVSRVGPQLAMTILSRLPVHEIAMAVMQENEKILASVPGIGVTSAKRIILELRKKVSSYLDEIKPVSSGMRSDAVLALVSLGFSEQEANNAVSKVRSEISGEDVSMILKEALRHLKH